MTDKVRGSLIKTIVVDDASSDNEDAIKENQHYPPSYVDEMQGEAIYKTIVETLTFIGEYRYDSAIPIAESFHYSELYDFIVSGKMKV